MKIFSKPIETPYTCKINDREFKSIKGLSVYVAKTLNMDRKVYYDSFINGEKIKCHFCGNDGRFISLTKGYTNLCKSDMCISKSRSTYTIEGIMYNKQCTKEEAELILEKLQKNNKQKNKEISDSYSELELKENSNWTKEFWIKKGYSEEYALLKISEKQKSNNKQHTDKLKNDGLYREEWSNKQSNTLQYWKNLGYSDIDAHTKLSERQTTFSLAICIETYGEVEGLKRWQQRQDKWMATMDAKSPEEKLAINLKKMLNNSGYSKQSQKLFWSIYKEFESNNIVFQELSDREVIMYNKEINSIYKFDYVDFTNKKIIEYNGDFWHCNPKLYKESYFHTVKQKSAKELWKYDKMKVNFAKDRGYDVLVIWEQNFKHNRDETIQQCIDFIKKKTNKKTNKKN